MILKSDLTTSLNMQHEHRPDFGEFLTAILKSLSVWTGRHLSNLHVQKKSQKSALNFSFDIVSLATLWLLRNSISHHKANASMDRQAIIQLAHASVNVFSLHHFRAFFFPPFSSPRATIILLARAPIHNPTLLCVFFPSYFSNSFFFVGSLFNLLKCPSIYCGCISSAQFLYPLDFFLANSSVDIICEWLCCSLAYACAIL